MRNEKRILDEAKLKYAFMGDFATIDCVVDTMEKDNVPVRTVHISFENSETSDFIRKLANNYLRRYDIDGKITNGIKRVDFKNTTNSINTDMIEFMYNYLEIDKDTISVFYSHFLNSFSHLSKRSTIRFEIIPRNIYDLSAFKKKPLIMYIDSEMVDGTTSVLYMDKSYIEENDLNYNNIKELFTSGVPLFTSELMSPGAPMFIQYSHDGYGRPTDDFLQISPNTPDTNIYTRKTYLTRDYRIKRIYDGRFEYKFRPESTHVDEDKYFMNAKVRFDYSSLSSLFGTIYVNKDNPDIRYIYLTLEGLKRSQFLIELGRNLIDSLGLKDKLISAKTYDRTTYNDQTDNLELNDEFIPILKKYLGDLPEIDMFNFSMLNTTVGRGTIMDSIFERITKLVSPETEVPLLAFNKYDSQVDDYLFELYEFKSVKDKFEFIDELKKYNILSEDGFRIGKKFMDGPVFNIDDIEVSEDYSNKVETDILMAIHMDNCFEINPTDFVIDSRYDRSSMRDIMKERNLVRAIC